MKPLVLAALLALVLPVAPAVAGDSPTRTTPSPTSSPHTSPLPAALPAASATAGTAPAPRAKAPTLSVTTRASGLSHAWDVKPIGKGRVLITERNPARLTVATAVRKRTVQFPTGRVWQSGETGLMGLEVDPGFASNGRFYTCQGWVKDNGGHDIRVIAWRMDDGATRATMIKPLLTGLPTTSGRHGGCRLLIAANGALIVGTGDAAVGTNPRDKSSLGGKTLRLDRMSGSAWPTNPFKGSTDRDRRYVLTYGHRNVQGLAQRADGTLWSVEHGSFRDDEVNKLVAGGDYGWNPVPGYDESVPMTDQSLPGKQYGARWRSGSSTLATSGATFVRGEKWGTLNGALAVAVLKSERLLFLTFDRRGRLVRSATPAALQRYGRLRTATQLSNGNLLVATDGADGEGRVLLVEPR